MASFLPRKPAAIGLLTKATDLIRVSIVEDDQNDQRAMRRMLDQSKEFACAGVYGSASEALEQILKVRPQVVLMDIRLPGMSGIECARRLKAALPGLVLIFVTGFCDAATMSEAFPAGGDGYLSKPLSFAQFLWTFRSAVWQRRMNAFKSRSDSARQMPSLTPRERAVMDGLASGLLCKEMAEQLHSSLAVIKKLRHSAFHKLGVTKSTEAVRCWLRRDWHQLK